VSGTGQHKTRKKDPSRVFEFDGKSCRTGLARRPRADLESCVNRSLAGFLCVPVIYRQLRTYFLDKAADLAFSGCYILLPRDTTLLFHPVFHLVRRLQ
jgi:hypothetical protein